MSGMQAANWPGGGMWITVLAAGLAATYVWRWLGVLLVKRIDPRSPALLLVRAVATALVAALVARMVFFPSGLLAQTSLATRLAALGCGLAMWRLGGRKVEPSVAVTVAVFFTLQLLS